VKPDNVCVLENCWHSSITANALTNCVNELRQLSNKESVLQLAT